MADLGALQILMYVAYAFLFIGTFYRAYRMSKMPVHLRWDLYPIPHEKGKAHYGGSYFEETDWWTKPAEVSVSGELKEMGKEILFIQSMYHNNKRLWFFSFPFHFGLYLSIVFVLLVFFGGLLNVLGISVTADSPNTIARIVHMISLPFGVIGAAAATFGAIGLFISRMVREELKRSSVRADFFNLLLLVAVFVSGFVVWIDEGFGYGALNVFIADLIAFRGTDPVSVGLAVHLALAAAFLIYLPFTHMTHFVGKYFTYHKVRWEDERNARGSKLEGRINEALGFKQTWAAPHIKTGATWGEAATAEDSENNE